MNDLLTQIVIVLAVAFGAAVLLFVVAGLFIMFGE